MRASESLRMGVRSVSVSGSGRVSEGKGRETGGAWVWTGLGKEGRGMGERGARWEGCGRGCGWKEGGARREARGCGRGWERDGGCIKWKVHGCGARRVWTGKGGFAAERRCASGAILRG